MFTFQPSSFRSVADRHGAAGHRNHRALPRQRTRVRHDRHSAAGRRRPLRWRQSRACDRRKRSRAWIRMAGSSCCRSKWSCRGHSARRSLSPDWSADCEYRLAGVRHCPNQQVFERLAALEPWRAMPSPGLSTKNRRFACSCARGTAAPVRIGQLASHCADGERWTLPVIRRRHASDPRASLMDWLATQGQGGTRCAMVAGSCPDFDLETVCSSIQSCLPRRR